MMHATAFQWQLPSRTSFGDPWLLLLTVLLVTFGLVMMTSASVEIASQDYGDPWYHFKRQCVFLLIGSIAGGSMLLVPMRFWYRSSGFLLVAAFAVLVLVLVPGLGHSVNGSRRWFRLGFMSLQASEPAKLGVLIYLAWYLSRYQERVRHSWVAFVWSGVVLSAIAALLIMEPDFGAVVVLSVAVFGMLFLAGVQLWQFLLAGIGAGALGFLLIQSSEYRVQRVMSFLQALQDPFAENVVFGSGYQLAQALIAFGRGDWFGLGLGNSLQKMYFLPEAHTDFVLAIIAEELGVLAVIGLLLLFLALVLRALRIARANERCGRLFAAYLAYGIAFTLMTQVLINAGVNVGLLPTKGLTMPFISYGGSSLIMCCMMVGLLLRIDIEHQLQQAPLTGGRAA